MEAFNCNQTPDTVCIPDKIDSTVPSVQEYIDEG